uniref:BRMS1 transcriptional repressor and anoikis regulator n=1 Tax=Equus caballus TaxID=9796 RepID=A0A9L0RBS3_HORSE
MPVQPPSKDTEEMEAEGDSAAEMNGEEEESEEERSGSQTESEEESSEMDDEDYERRRSECVNEMLDLEKQFSELKEKVRSSCCMTPCRASCRSGSRGWRRTARAWTSALSGGMTNCMPEAARRRGTLCHPARGRRLPSFLVSFHPRWPEPGRMSASAPAPGEGVEGHGGQGLIGHMY